MTEAEELELLELEELEAKKAGRQAPPQDEVSGWESAGRGVVAGATLDFDDEIGGGFGALGRKLAGDQRPFGDVYRSERDLLRRKKEAAREANPWTYGLSGVVPTVGAALLTGGAGAAPALGRLAATGAAIGGASALGASEADITKGEAGEALTDTALGAGLGAGVGVALPTAGAALRRAARPVASGLRRLGINQGRRVLLNGADSLSNRLPTSDEAVEEALRSKAIRPFSTTQKAFQRLEGLTDQQGARYGQIIEALEARGVRGPDAKALADELLSRGVALEPNTMDPALVDEFLAQGQRIMEKVPKGTDRLRLSQAENLKRSLQDKARYDIVGGKPLNDVRKEIASVVRQANEDAIDAAARVAGGGSETERIAREFVPTKQRLGRLIEARDAAERGAQRSAQRRGVGLTDYMAAMAGSSGGATPALLTGGANNFLRNRGTSAVARGAYGISELLRKPASETGRSVATPVAARFVADMIRQPRIRVLTPEEFEDLLAEER